MQCLQNRILELLSRDCSSAGLHNTGTNKHKRSRSGQRLSIQEVSGAEPALQLHAGDCQRQQYGSVNHKQAQAPYGVGGVNSQGWSDDPNGQPRCCHL